MPLDPLTPPLRPRPFGPSRWSGLTLQQRQQRQLVRSLVEVIECECVATELAGSRWYDTRPMLSEHENAPQLVDLNREILDLGSAMGVIAQHPLPMLGHLVQIRVDADAN